MPRDARRVLELVTKRGRNVNEDRIQAKAGPRCLVHAKERERRVR
jgi:(2Fe-2S) ferredoxin